MIERTEAFGLQFEFPSGDLAVGRCLRDYGEFGAVAVALGGQLAAGGVFVDVGANIGAIALPIARKATRVIAIEAHAGLAALLESNVRTNRLDNVTVVHAAAGAAGGIAAFPTPDISERRNFGATGFALTDAPRREVTVVTLDELAPPETKLVKIDVEGYEGEVLAGAATTLTRIRPCWIVETDRDTPSTRATISTLAAAGYRLWWFYVPFVTPTAPRRGPADRVRGDVNVLAVPIEAAQPWDMPAVDLNAPWPHDTRQFPYLARFGFQMS